MCIWNYVMKHQSAKNKTYYIMMKLKCLISYSIFDDNVSDSFASMIESMGYSTSDDSNIYYIPFSSLLSIDEIKQRIAEWNNETQLDVFDIINLYYPNISSNDGSDLRITRARYFLNEKAEQYEWDWTE